MVSGVHTVSFRLTKSGVKMPSKYSVRLEGIDHAVAS